MVRSGYFVTVAALALAACGEAPAPLSITGSSTVFPFTQAVAESFAKAGEGAPLPTIKSVGTVGGIKTFCEGPGGPEILDASRRITTDEYAKCRANKVGDILEIPIGLDGIALAESNAGPKLAVTAKELYLALAAAPLGKPNAATKWSDINPALPSVAIKVLGPPESSATRASFITLILERGCLEANPEAATLRMDADPAKFDAACRQIRADGPYVTAGEDDGATVKALEQDPQAVGLLGYSYLERDAARLRAVPINTVVPSAETIGNGTYPGVRLLYLYVKKARMPKNPAIQQFITLYADMAKAGGPLTQRGLIPLSPKASARALDIVKNGFPLEPGDLT